MAMRRKPNDLEGVDWPPKIGKGRVILLVSLALAAILAGYAVVTVARNAEEAERARVKAALEMNAMSANRPKSRAKPTNTNQTDSHEAGCGWKCCGASSCKHVIQDSRGNPRYSGEIPNEWWCYLNCVNGRPDDWRPAAGGIWCNSTDAHLRVIDLRSTTARLHQGCWGPYGCDYSMAGMHGQFSNGLCFSPVDCESSITYRTSCDENASIKCDCEYSEAVFPEYRCSNETGDWSIVVLSMTPNYRLTAEESFYCCDPEVRTYKFARGLGGTFRDNKAAVDAACVQSRTQSRGKPTTSHRARTEYRCSVELRPISKKGADTVAKWATHDWAVGSTDTFPTKAAERSVCASSAEEAEGMLAGLDPSDGIVIMDIYVMCRDTGMRCD